MLPKHTASFSLYGDHVPITTVRMLCAMMKQTHFQARERHRHVALPPCTSHSEPLQAVIVI